MRHSRWRTRVGTTLIAAVTITIPGFAIAAAPAQAAGSAGLLAVVDDTVVEYKTARGKQSKVMLTRSGNTITVDDRVAVKVGAGCKRVKGDKTRAQCTPKKAPTRLRVYAYDRNDSIVNKSGLPMTADGGTGNDKLTGGPSHDRLYGRAGNDKIWGLGGNDTIAGNEGDDRLYGGAGDDGFEDGPGTDIAYGGAGGDGFVNYSGNDKFYGQAGDDNYSSRERKGRDADLYSGGAGVDSAWYTYHSAVSLDLDGAKGDDGRKGEGDTITADVENLLGGAGNDRLVGNNATNYLDGREGNDVIYAHGGNDTLLGHEGLDKLYGGSGDDWLDGRDGAGRDSALDRLDAGANTAVGDSCVAKTPANTVGCEILRPDLVD